MKRRAEQQRRAVALDGPGDVAPPLVVTTAVCTHCNCFRTMHDPPKPRDATCCNCNAVNAALAPES